jgi:predicted transcriptional regulator
MRKANPITMERKALIENVLADRLRGMSLRTVALKHGVSMRTVSAYTAKSRANQADTNNVEQSRPKSDTVKSIVADYRPRLAELAVKAVENGLSSNRDEYRQADIGLRTLQGLGELNKDQQGSSTLALVLGGLPASMAPYFQDCIDVELEQPSIPSAPGSVQVAERTRENS